MAGIANNNTTKPENHHPAIQLAGVQSVDALALTAAGPAPETVIQLSPACRADSFQEGPGVQQQRS